jgi:hypothetical protein
VPRRRVDDALERRAAGDRRSTVGRDDHRRRQDERRDRCPCPTAAWRRTPYKRVSIQVLSVGNDHLRGRDLPDGDAMKPDLKRFPPGIAPKRAERRLPGGHSSGPPSAPVPGGCRSVDRVREPEGPHATRREPSRFLRSEAEAGRAARDAQAVAGDHLAPAVHGAAATPTPGRSSRRGGLSRCLAGRGSSSGQGCHACEPVRVGELCMALAREKGEGLRDAEASRSPSHRPRSTRAPRSRCSVGTPPPAAGTGPSREPTTERDRGRPRRNPHLPLRQVSAR